MMVLPRELVPVPNTPIGSFTLPTHSRDAHRKSPSYPVYSLIKRQSQTEETWVFKTLKPLIAGPDLLEWTCLTKKQQVRQHAKRIRAIRTTFARMWLHCLDWSDDRLCSCWIGAIQLFVSHTKSNFASLLRVGFLLLQQSQHWQAASLT